MKKGNIIFTIIILFLAGCSSSKKVFQNERIFTFDNLNLKYVVELEEKLNSEDISPDYRIGLGKGIYPNTNNYKLEISRNYKRIIKPYFSLEVDYHFTKDSLIRVVMYEWKELKKEDDFSYKSEKENLKTKKIFDRKFDKLRRKLTKEFGEPSFIEIQSKSIKKGETYRNGIKWLNKKGMNSYLFAFGNSEGTYNEMRLAIYPE